MCPVHPYSTAVSGEADFFQSSLDVVDMSVPRGQVRSCIAFYDPGLEAIQHFLCILLIKAVYCSPRLKRGDISATS